MDEWRDAQPALQKGCGCLVLLLVGLFMSGLVIGAMMGDYGGPPEGAAADSREKGFRICLGLTGLVFCFVAGTWLTGKGSGGKK